MAVHALAASVRSPSQMTAEPVISPARDSDAPKCMAVHALAASVRSPSQMPAQRIAIASQGVGLPFPARSASMPAPARMAAANETTPIHFSGYRNADQSGTTL